MGDDGTGDFTLLLRRAREGDRKAEDALLRLAYDELRAVARRRMARVPAEDTLQPTALVHEAWLRLAGKEGVEWQGRRHFFALAARAMHDVLVEQARRHAAKVRGGGRRRVELADGPDERGRSPQDILEISEAIAALRAAQPLAAEAVELRFFAGLGHEEVAEALEIPLIRARREWAYARAFLQERLEHEAGPRDGHPA